MKYMIYLIVMMIFLLMDHPEGVVAVLIFMLTLEVLERRSQKS